MKINQLWVFHVQRDREYPYISSYVAMSDFTGISGMANWREERVLKVMEGKRSIQNQVRSHEQEQTKGEIFLAPAPRSHPFG